MEEIAIQCIKCIIRENLNIGYRIQEKRTFNEWKEANGRAIPYANIPKRLWQMIIWTNNLYASTIQFVDQNEEILRKM